MANPRIIPKKSAISKVPSSSDLVSGEVAVNYADQQWYGKHPSTGAIVEIGAPAIHSHDELYSLDKSQQLELTNAGNLVVTGATTKTFSFPSASGTIATLADITGSTAGVTSVNTRTGVVTLDKTDVGLSNVDNTSDVNKPISTATQTALDSKASTSHPNLIAAPGTKTLAVFTPRNNYPPATAFATLDTRNSIAVLDFDDGATNEAATFCGIIPEAANLSAGLIVRIRWMATTATSGNCRWGAEWEKSETDLDANSFDTATEAHTAAPSTSGIEATTSLTCTAIDSLAAGDRFRLRVYRDSSDTTNDTMTGDAELIAVEVRSAA